VKDERNKKRKRKREKREKKRRAIYMGMGRWNPNVPRV
jgi:hypothetical protein